MAQNDLVIANQTFPNFRNDINSALAALNTQQSGTSAPSPTSAYMLWADTTNDLLRMRNSTNSGWVTLGKLGVSNLGHAVLDGSDLNVSGDITANGTTTGKSLRSNYDSVTVASGANSDVAMGGYGFVMVRDNTAGGQALIMFDSSSSLSNAQGCTVISSTMINFTFSRQGFTTLRITNGTPASRNILVGRLIT